MTHHDRLVVFTAGGSDAMELADDLEGGSESSDLAMTWG